MYFSPCVVMTSTQLEGGGGRCCSCTGWDTTGAGWDTTGAGWDTTGAGWDTTGAGWDTTNKLTSRGPKWDLLMAKQEVENLMTLEV
jgi:hypothetical protein